MDRHKSALALLHAGTVIPAMPLALTAGRALDERRQRALIRYYIAAGAGGIAAAVHTTQFAIRKPEYALFEPVLELVAAEITALERADGRAIIRVAGACGETAQAVRETKTAFRLGYDAVLLSPGGLIHLSEDEMIARTRAVAEIMPVIGFYLQPAVGGRQFLYEYWTRIAEIPNVVAIKVAPFNRYMTLDAARAVAQSNRRGEIALYTGNDDNIIVDLLTEYRFGNARKSFAGGLLGHWSVWTKSAVEMFDKVQKRENIPELLWLANCVTDANAAFFDAANGYKGCIAGIHEVLRRQGLMEGITCLDPNETLSPGQAREIDRVYAAYPFLNDDAFVKENLETWLK